jgi:hypothetical protein
VFLKYIVTIYDEKLILHTYSNVAIFARYLIESEMYTAWSPFITYSVNSRVTKPHTFIGGPICVKNLHARCPEDGGSRFLKNVGNHIHDFTVS